MNKRKFLIIALVHSASIILGFIYRSDNASAMECFFDSYIIIDGKCIDLSKKSNVNTVHKTIYRYRDKDKLERQNNLFNKTCKDFEYQNSAQIYFARNPEYKKKFDSDNDGYVCEHLKRTDNVLNRKIWQTLLYENRQVKTNTSNKHALTFQKANSIIGFAPTSKRKGNKYVWEDKISNKKIEIRFFNGEIEDMKSVGF